MKKLTTLLNIESDDALFNYIIATLKTKGITQWDYFVKWEKVHNNIKPYEVELNILNVLIGKEDIKEELTKYPTRKKQKVLLLSLSIVVWLL